MGWQGVWRIRRLIILPSSIHLYSPFSGTLLDVIPLLPRLIILQGPGRYCLENGKHHSKVSAPLQIV